MKKYIFVLVLPFVCPDITQAAEYATFEAFYKEASYIGWILAGVVALITAAVIFFTGGMASPIVVGLGTWIGGMMGLSGIAATNAGLALMGGGSLVAGGFGIAGGVAVLTAALSFSTDIVFDYTIGKAVSEYKYSNLQKQSKAMVTLPLPVNTSGPEVYEEAMESLEIVDGESALNTPSNQLIIATVIGNLESDKRRIKLDELAKVESLLSVLYFVSNDYQKAKAWAKLSIQTVGSANDGTLPCFIFAASSLYDEKVDFSKLTNVVFSYSILTEPDNPLIPLIFSIYLDRLMLRFNDNYLDEKALAQIFVIMQNPAIEDFRLINYTNILSRYFMRLKMEQQKIRSLAGTSNSAIKNNPKTYLAISEALRVYKALLHDSGNVMRHYSPLEMDMDEESKSEVEKFEKLLADYKSEESRLTSIVAKFGHDQNHDVSFLDIISLMWQPA